MRPKSLTYSPLTRLMRELFAVHAEAETGTVKQGYELVSLRARNDGTYRLSFDQGNKTVDIGLTRRNTKRRAAYEWPSPTTEEVP